MHFLQKTILLIVCLAALQSGVYSAVTVSESDGCLTLANSKVSLEINRGDLSLRQMKDIVRGENYVSKSGGGFFSISLWDPENPGLPGGGYRRGPSRTVELNSDEAKKFEYWKSVQGNETTLFLKYKKIPAGKGYVDVTVTVKLAADSDLFEWGLFVSNFSPFKLYAVTFRLQGLGADSPGCDRTDYLAIPARSGEVRNSPRTMKPLWLNYPSDGMTIQMASYCDGKGGALYFASHDKNGFRKDLGFASTKSRDSFEIKLWHPVEHVGAVWKLPYPIYCGPIQGDWYDAAKIYKKKFADKVWMSLDKRNDIAPWFSTLGIWFKQYWDPKDTGAVAMTERLLKLREMLGEEFGFHWYLWTKHPRFDYRYPDYLPAISGFKESTETLQRAGVHVMPYTNLILFDPALPMWKDEHADEAVSRDVAGEFDQLHSGFKMKDCILVPMCFGTTYWKNKITGIEEEILQKYSVDALYLDLLVCYPEICFSRNHKHDAAGGNYYIGERRKTISRLRSLDAWGKRSPVITGENLNEAYMASCDGLLVAHSDVAPDTLPIFQTVNSNHTTEIGLEIFRADILTDTFFCKMGFALTRGRQLGWINLSEFNVMLPEYRKQFEALRKFCHTRRTGLEFLFYGELLRTPDLSAVPQVERPWKTRAKEVRTYTLPAVLGECYRAPNGDLGLILVNHSDRALTFTIPWNSRDWGAPFEFTDRQDFLDDAWKDNRRNLPGVRGIDVSIPAYSPMIIKLVSASVSRNSEQNVLQ